MHQTQDRKWTTLLFNPFVYVAGGRALGLGVAALLVAGFVGALGLTHFDGVLDTHSGTDAPLWFFLAEGVVDWLCLAVVLLILGKIISPTAFRIVDLLGTQALARWPTILTALVTLPPGFRRFSNQLLLQVTHPGTPIQFSTPDTVVFVAGALLTLLLTCWMVVLMYNGYSVSCNVRGGKAIGTFIAAIILGEILSKIALTLLLVGVGVRLTP